MTLSRTNRQRWKLTTVLLAATLAATANVVQAQEADATASSGTLTIGWAWDPSTMDSQMHRQRYTQIISHAMRDKLMYQAPPGLTYVPLLAESLTQVDDTHYDLKLREGVLFHNGDELTSEDVVYTFERLWDPETESPRARMGNMSNVEGVEAIDRYTIRWTTKIPFGPAGEAKIGLHLGGQEILHKATYENLTMEEAATAPVMGVGPFKFVEWVQEQRVVMEANQDYWQGVPGVEKIIWRTIPEEATRVAELLAGSVDIIHPVGPDVVPQLRAAGMNLEVVSGTASRMLMMSVREGSPFADIEVRKAMNMAINRNDIVDYIYTGLATAQLQVAGFSQQGYIEGYDPFPYNPDAARAVLSNVTEPIELFVQPRWELAAQAIAEQLRGYGMDVSTIVLDRASHTQKDQSGEFDLMFGDQGYGSGLFTGAYYNNRFDCSRFETNRIRTGFCNEELDAKMADAVSEIDPDARREKVEEINRLLSETYVPWVPLFNQSEVWAMQPYVQGFVGSSAGQMFDLWKVTVD